MQCSIASIFLKTPKKTHLTQFEPTLILSKKLPNSILPHIRCIVYASKIILTVVLVNVDIIDHINLT